MTNSQMPVTLPSARESMWGRSSEGERRICNADVVGSNPSASTKQDGLNGSSFLLSYFWKVIYAYNQEREPSKSRSDRRF